MRNVKKGRLRKRRTDFLLERMSWRQRVDFTNILFKVFTRADPKSAKNTVKPSVFLAL